MNKKEIFKALELQIAGALEVMTKAALAAHEGATHAESKAEDQYDTRGLEASYLAGAQSKRAMELEEQLAIYRNIDVKHFTDTTPISATALVELECDRKSFYYLLMPKGGGLHVTVEGKTIHVITPQAPLGEALLGQSVGCEFSVRLQNKERDYSIVKVW